MLTTYIQHLDPPVAFAARKVPSHVARLQEDIESTTFSRDEKAKSLPCMNMVCSDSESHWSLL